MIARSAWKLSQQHRSLAARQRSRLGAGQVAGMACMPGPGAAGIWGTAHTQVRGQHSLCSAHDHCPELCIAETARTSASYGAMCFSSLARRCCALAAASVLSEAHAGAGSGGRRSEVLRRSQARDPGARRKHLMASHHEDSQGARLPPPTASASQLSLGHQPSLARTPSHAPGCAWPACRSGLPTMDFEAQPPRSRRLHSGPLSQPMAARAPQPLGRPQRTCRRCMCMRHACPPKHAASHPPLKHAGAAGPAKRASLEHQEGSTHGNRDSVRSSTEDRELQVQRTQRRSRAFDAAFAEAQQPKAPLARNSNDVRPCVGVAVLLLCPWDRAAAGTAACH